MIDKEKILSEVSEAAKPFVLKAFEESDNAIKSQTTVSTKFADKEVIDEARGALSYVAEVDCRPFGGYRGANRARLCIFSSRFVDDSFTSNVSYFQLITTEPPLTCDEVIVGLRKASILNDDVGDVFNTPYGWQGIMAKEVISIALDKEFEINGVLCRIIELDQADVNFPNQSVREIKSTVASLRLDAIAGSGFGASRTRMAEEIKAGRLKLNGKVTTSASALIRESDVIVAKGRGRIVVSEVRGETKKGRIAILLNRYGLG